MTTIRNFAQEHPQITAWIALAIGMVIILVWSARDVGFNSGQWAALIVTTILLAGACVWIISWGEDEEAEASQAVGTGEAALNETGETEEADQSPDASPPSPVDRG